MHSGMGSAPPTSWYECRLLQVVTTAAETYSPREPFRE